MQGDLLKKLISSVYANRDNILLQCAWLDELEADQLKFLEGFHMQELYLLEENDDYFCGIRANHFCVEYGFSEYIQEAGKDCSLILITANHKGNRAMTLLKIN